jgi:hypothetical protein
LNSIETISASNISRLNALETTSASVDTLNSNQNTRLNSLEDKTGSLATTGSNTFYGTQTFTGSVYIKENLIVQGSSSLQNITASAVSIGTNIVNLNTANPAIRYAGLVIGDSGSIGGSGSFLYDSVQDEMLFIHRGDSSVVTSSVTLMGPETYDNVGNEIYLTNNRLPKGTGKEHLVDSNISDDGTTIKLPLNTEVTGSFKLTSNLTFGLTGDRSIGWGGNTQSAAANSVIYSDNNYLALNSKAGSKLYLNYDNTNASSTIDCFAGKATISYLGAATFASTLKVGGAVGNFLIDSYTTSKIGIRSWTDIAGTTNNFFLQNNANYNYGIIGVVSASGTATGDVYALGYSPSAGTSMTSVLNWTSEGKVWSAASFGVGVSPTYGALDVRSSSTSVSTLDGVSGFFKNTPKGGGLSIRVHDTQVDLAATWFYGATNMDLTLTTVATDGVYRERMRIQASDGAMAFNTSITGVRSYLFKALPNRQLAIEALESGGVHSIYLRPSSTGRNLIASNYFGGGVYLPLALSGRENDTDLVLHANGNISINSSSDIGSKFQINAANYVEMATFACTTAGAATIITDNAGYVQFSNGTARHLSNTSVFTAVTDGIRILKAGMVHVTVSQDITTSGTTGYTLMYIQKNKSTISENLITNTNGEWDGMNGVATISVAADDVINFYYSASNITSFDPNTWSQYSFIWTSR